MKDVQDFIEKYYPNYYSCDIIAIESDLYKIVMNEVDEGSTSEELLKEYSQHELTIGQPKIDLLEVQSLILEKAIEGFINYKNKNKHGCN